MTIIDKSFFRENGNTSIHIDKTRYKSEVPLIPSKKSDALPVYQMSIINARPL